MTPLSSEEETRKVMEDPPPDQPDHPLFLLRGVGKSYRKKPALEDINIGINNGEITGIIGPDGAGKSTLLKICAGILRYSGSLLYEGRELSSNPERIKRDLSYMPQGIGHNLYMDLTVEENIRFFGHLKGVEDSAINERSRELLEATGLAPFRTRFARDLSGGMKQKLGICCSLISLPRVLILDEPSTGIDPLSRRELWKLLNSYLHDTGTGILLGTSYMDEAERCHSIMFLHHGRPVYQGHPELLMKKQTGLEEAFFERLLEMGETLSEVEPPPDFPGHQAEGRVEVREVSKYFGDFQALRDVSLSIRPGEVFGLLGPNGAGKTTLIKCMTGLLTPDGGDISIAGQPSGSEQLPYAIGYMSQVFSLYGDLSVKENIELYGSIYGLEGRTLAGRMEWVLDFSGLSGQEGSLVKALPLGMKQRLALGVASIHLPAILFLDEPTSGVDPVARKQFWNYIRMLADKLRTTVIVTTHNLVEADYTDRVGIMDSGQLIGLGSPEELRSEFLQYEGTVFEITPEHPLDEDLLGREGLSIAPFGRRYHIWKKGLSRAALGAALERAGMKDCHIREIPPPMEDVFVYYLRKGRR